MNYLMTSFYRLFLSSFLFALSFHSFSASNHLGNCGDERHSLYQSIPQIQGPGNVSPILGKQVVLEGIVTLALQGAKDSKGNQSARGYRGFWLQQNQSSIPLHQKSSSQGIFVYHAKNPVKEGQRIRLRGLVAEYEGLTEIKKVQSIIVCVHSQPLPKAVALSLPVKSLSEFERLEGMRIKLTPKPRLLVSDLYGAGYGLGNYGQFAVSSKLHFQPTELMTVAEITASPERLLAKRKDYLLIDDGSYERYPNYIPFPNRRGFSGTNFLLVGDEVKGLEGILHAYGQHYIVIPDAKEMDSSFITPSQIKMPQVDVRANVVVASMNVGNYFNGSPVNLNQLTTGFPTSRGANSYQGFKMQRQKLVAALIRLDADIIGLMELENDGYGDLSAIADLTRALNSELTGELQYQYIIPYHQPEKRLGKDAISVGILYRSHKIKPLGAALILDASNSNNSFDDNNNRPSLIQKFKVNENEILLAVNHFKSKGRPCGEADRNGLQGYCNQIRTQAARSLSQFIQQKTIADKDLGVLILGDLNSYSQEDPLLTLYAEGYTNLKKKGQFSYSFQGYLGNLDHALANSSLLPKVRSVDAWNINSVADVLLDYHTEENGHDYPSIDHYAQPDEIRSSDHDPIIIGLEF